MHVSQSCGVHSHTCGSIIQLEKLARTGDPSPERETVSRTGDKSLKIVNFRSPERVKDAKKSSFDNEGVSGAVSCVDF